MCTVLPDNMCTVLPDDMFTVLSPYFKCEVNFKMCSKDKGICTFYQKYIPTYFKFGI